MLLPDTRSSERYVSFDAPYLTKAFEAAGLGRDDFSIQNAQGSATTMQTQADAAIINGASVLIIDALDSGSGAAIEQDAHSKGVAIDCDRLTLNGSSTYSISFDNVVVGRTIGQGSAGIVYASRLRSVSTNLDGGTLVLYAVAAAVIGGARPSTPCWAAS